MIPQFAIHAREPWSIEETRLRDAMAMLAAARPPAKPTRQAGEDGVDMADDWSRNSQHNEARLMIQKVGNGTALLQVRGVLLKECPFWAWVEGYATSMAMLDEALEMVGDMGYSALILECKSPGGSCLGMHETAEAIKSLRKRGIRVTAYTSTVCASAMYYIASACDEIFASPGAMVGSIGTYSVFTDFSAAAEMAGLKFRVFKGGEAPLKAAGADGTLTEAQAADMQRHVDEYHAMFIAQVKEGRRGLKIEEAATGSWWKAMSAPRGMVDDATLFHSVNDLIKAWAS